MSLGGHRASRCGACDFPICTWAVCRASRSCARPRALRTTSGGWRPLRPRRTSRWSSTATCSTRWPRTPAVTSRSNRPRRPSRASSATPSFSGIWDALATFVQTARRKLVVVIGNHDIEIAFPPVQRLVVDRLAGGDEAARGRIEFSIMGAGYTCMVAGSRVYCVHGNEVDAWNYNRYEDSRARRPPPERRPALRPGRVAAERRHEDGQGGNEHGQAPLRVDRPSQAGDQRRARHADGD